MHQRMGVELRSSERSMFCINPQHQLHKQVGLGMVFGGYGIIILYAIICSCPSFAFKAIEHQAVPFKCGLGCQQRQVKNQSSRIRPACHAESYFFFIVVAVIDMPFGKPFNAGCGFQISKHALYGREGS